MQAVTRQKRILFDRRRDVLGAALRELWRAGRKRAQDDKTRRTRRLR